jgi:hypothetical protein
MRRWRSPPRAVGARPAASAGARPLFAFLPSRSSHGARRRLERGDFNGVCMVECQQAQQKDGPPLHVDADGPGRPSLSPHFRRRALLHHRKIKRSAAVAPLRPRAVELGSGGSDRDPVRAALRSRCAAARACAANGHWPGTQARAQRGAGCSGGRRRRVRAAFRSAPGHLALHNWYLRVRGRAAHARSRPACGVRARVRRRRGKIYRR